MKKILILSLIVCISLPVLSQKKCDLIELNNNEIIECYIVTVKSKHLFYQMLIPPYKIKKQSIDQVKSYEFNDMFFQTNANGILEHSEVIKLDGFSQNQIYRAPEDWFSVNSNSLIDGVYTEYDEYFFIHGSIITKDYWKFNFKPNTNVPDVDSVLRKYNISYDLLVRAKDNRFKIIMNNYVLYNTLVDKKSRTLKNVFEKRYTVDKTKTLAYLESLNMTEFIKEQITSLENHCIYISDKDTFKEALIKYILSNDIR